VTEILQEHGKRATLKPWNRPKRQMSDQHERQSMAVIKVRDLAYARLQSPDLDAQEEFLTAFGMVRAARTPTALYMRGHRSSAPHPRHRKGRAEVHRFCMDGERRRRSESNLKVFWCIRYRDPRRTGGGKRVRLTEPNGFAIEIVYGIENVQPIQVVRQPINSGIEPLKRAGEVIRFAAGPSSVKRIGHAVLGSPKNQETVRWFRDTLGLAHLIRTGWRLHVGSGTGTLCRYFPCCWLDRV
jgi:hypothetical protein